MNEYIKEENNVLYFDLYKVEYGREKICRCQSPHYEIDDVNRIVMCTDCKAVIDPFMALVNICEHAEKYKEYQKEALKKIETYREWANEESRRRFKNRCFKEMEGHYMSGLFPQCPNCEELIDPVKITRWSRPD